MAFSLACCKTRFCSTSFSRIDCDSSRTAACDSATVTWSATTSTICSSSMLQFRSPSFGRTRTNIA
ncbi:hypothetical protein HanPSC8_Chr05g0207741 [Helianthus annuus]|nr:hypothetical protein HanPSC8_Chr05g0207741 [Helianthus annuus]